FGAMPFLPPERMAKEFSGYAEVLELELGRKVVFETREDFDTYEQAVRDQVFDIVWVPPFDVPLAMEAGYERLMRTDQDFAAIFVTNLSTVASLADLDNRKLGMTRPMAATTRLATMALKAQNLFGKVQAYHFRDHQDCLDALMRHEVSACVTHPVPVGLFERARNIRLTVIYETVKIPSSVIAIHSRVPVTTTDRIVQTLTTLHDRPYGQEVLAEPGIPEAWVTTGPEEYLKLQERGLSKPAIAERPIEENY
ncbi:MAG: PhnD/SsuA/transferrin family substrate-binding protein, partial [Pseudomonadales bacterium]|nr:PhnD/SsuA/transferrin family substrate-binding protein [Pseudomonadales bacterium]